MSKIHCTGASIHKDRPVCGGQGQHVNKTEFRKLDDKSKCGKCKKSRWARGL